MRDIVLSEDCYYHIYNRGVDKRRIFMNDSDRYRFIHDLYELNDENYAPPFARRQQKTVGRPASNSRQRKLLVKIICFCLMPNHFHLLLTPINKNGISVFLHKLGTGYAKYFNEKYERSGAFFQGRFKAKYIDNDAYLTHLTKYIHLNPVDLMEPEWREKGLKNPQAACDFLKGYKWSSFKDYIGIKNYPSLIEKRLIMDMIGGEAEYEKFAFGKFYGSLDAIKSYIIE